MVDPIKTLHRDIKSIGLFPHKYQGQNYLISPRIRNNIIVAAKISSEDQLIEIGSGTGILTYELLKKSSSLIAIELEKKCSNLLMERFGNIPGVQIISGDAVKWLENFRKSRPQKKYKLIANLPYSISSPVVTQIAYGYPAYKRVVIMVQKEVAERIAADPGCKARGLLSILM